MKRKNIKGRIMLIDLVPLKEENSIKRRKRRNQRTYPLAHTMSPQHLLS